MTLQLRPYQSAAKAAFYSHLQSRDDNPCIVLPTAAGKTPLMASICSDVHNLWKGRICIIAHVKELLEQTRQKLLDVDPSLPVGVYSAGLNRRDKHYSITIAGIQSIYKRAHEFDPFDIILIDECHRIPTDGEGMYRKFLQNCKMINPNCRLGGLTATPYRLDVGEICGPDNLLNHICYSVSVKQLIHEGFISRVKSRSATEVADMSNVHVRGGEYIADEMAAAFDTDVLVESACKEILTLAHDRKGILIFCSSIQHAEHVASKLAELGTFPGIVHSERENRDEVIADFKSQRTRILINVNVLCEGFDATHVDCVVLLRATLSPGLYYQMVGRGFRLHEGKEFCLVLDFGTNIERHGPVDMIKIENGKKSGAAPTKECPSCKYLIAASYSVCPECGHVFPPRDEVIARHGTQSSKAGIISGETTDEKLPVRSVHYGIHHKKGTAPGDHPPTLRVDYVIGNFGAIRRSEWVCIEHDGFAGNNAQKWWKRRTLLPFPETVDEAVRIAQAGGLAEPIEITIRENAGEKWPKIIAYNMGEAFVPGDGWEGCEVAAVSEAVTDSENDDIPF